MAESLKATAVNKKVSHKTHAPLCGVLQAQEGMGCRQKEVKGRGKTAQRFAGVKTSCYFCPKYETTFLAHPASCVAGVVAFAHARTAVGGENFSLPRLPCAHGSGRRVRCCTGRISCRGRQRTCAARCATQCRWALQHLRLYPIFCDRTPCGRVRIFCASLPAAPCAAGGTGCADDHIGGHAARPAYGVSAAFSSLSFFSVSTDDAPL